MVKMFFIGQFERSCSCLFLLDTINILILPRYHLVIENVNIQWNIAEYTKVGRYPLNSYNLFFTVCFT